MVEPFWFFGIPPFLLLWALVKCHYEVEGADIDDQWEADKLYFKCVIDEIVPGGLPDPDRYNDEK